MSYNLTSDERKKIITEQSAHLKSSVEFVSAIKDYVLSEKKAECVLLEDNLKPIQIIQMCLDRNVKHVIQNSKLSTINKMLLIDKVLKNPIDFLTFNTNLFNDPDKKLCFSFHSKENRSELVNKVIEFLEIDPKNHNTEHVLKCSEELIMNAQVHAPRIGDFKSPHNMGFLVEKKVDYIALSVFDDYGSMNLNKFLKKILSTFSIGLADSINYGSGGAGLGSSIIFESSEVLYIAVLPKKITRVTLLTPIKVRAKDREIEQKSIHIIDSL